MSKRKTTTLLNKSKKEYNIYVVDYFETGYEVLEIIYVNYSNMRNVL